MGTFSGRVIRALRLDKNLFEEMEADEQATGQAMSVVILSCIAGGLGYSGLGGLRWIFMLTVTALAGWVIWAMITYIVGTKILPSAQTRSNPGELLRTLGFAHAPGLFYIFGLLPLAGKPVMFAVSLWVLAAWVIAVRQALDYTSTARAVAVCLIGWVFYMAARLFVIMFLKGFAAVLGG